MDNCPICHQEPAQDPHHIWPRGAAGKPVETRCGEGTHCNIIHLGRICHDALPIKARLERICPHGKHYSPDGVAPSDGTSGDYLFSLEGKLLWRRPWPSTESDLGMGALLHGLRLTYEDLGEHIDRVGDEALIECHETISDIDRREAWKVRMFIHAEAFSRAFAWIDGQPPSDWARCEMVAKTLGISARTVWNHIKAIRKYGPAYIREYQGPMAGLVVEEHPEPVKRKCCQPESISTPETGGE